MMMFALRTSRGLYDSAGHPLDPVQAEDFGMVVEWEVFAAADPLASARLSKAHPEDFPYTELSELGQQVWAQL